ncbi:MAG TPA: aspartyl/asparaginyl beta-hydroxylase domain-containing protein [Sphingomicrobium sp.]|jgi:aspartyl/asparaginyl beta-hydroxylase (cupin superfamily)|nr:aspartyl/asparaginyl beta-hydroxylase domain-containing protein [Sphingomicrobium sp.]
MNGSSPSADVRELLGRGDDYVRQGDGKTAMVFYQAALKSAQGTSFIEPQTMERLRAAQAFIQKRATEFQEALERAFSGTRPASEAAQIRLEHSLEMLKGERQIYQQQPSAFYYPYLSQRQFFEREEFDWVPELERAADSIREELAAVLEEGADFRPYVESRADRPYRDFHGLNEDPSWTALYLLRNGKAVEENAKRFPSAMAALGRVPLTSFGSRTPDALFSRLEPGAHIPPHTGLLNCRLICHLPLIVPEGCWLRVGNEKRYWEEGKLLIFDDSMEHEARNPSDELRIILLFDVWRPELTKEERSAMSAVFDAIDQFRGVPEG